VNKARLQLPFLFSLLRFGVGSSSVAVAAFAARYVGLIDPTLTRNVVKIKKFYGAADANLDSFAPRQYSHRY
jgi:hypothetical protein